MCGEASIALGQTSDTHQEAPHASHKVSRIRSCGCAFCGASSVSELLAGAPLTLEIAASIIVCFEFSLRIIATVLRRAHPSPLFLMYSTQHSLAVCSRGWDKVHPTLGSEHMETMQECLSLHSGASGGMRITLRGFDQALRRSSQSQPRLPSHPHKATVGFTQSKAGSLRSCPA